MCSEKYQRYLLHKLSAVKTVKDIYCYTKRSKNCQRYLLSTINAVKTFKNNYCLH